MGNEFTGMASHSAEYFGDTRDHWWNPDFLPLLAARWRLGAARDVLDVGCGVGHWSMLLGPHLAADARIVGVDRDAHWVATARARAERRGLSSRFRYEQGVAERLPFADGSFDLVTCQTVLIHVPDPRAALAEMIRVTRPGGLVAVVEPNNLSGTLLGDDASFRDGVDEVLASVRFQMVCERGKAALGEGDNSIGQFVPGYFAELGLSEVGVFLNDRASVMLPPYVGDAQRAEVDETLDRDRRDIAIWDRDETLRYFLAGGGSADDFDVAWAGACVRLRRAAAAMRAGTFRSAGGAVTYCISGRKPVSP